MPWGAVLGICIPALLFFIWDSRKHLRQGWWYVIILFMVFACCWRWHIHAGSSRYYAVLIVPLMLLVFNMFWGIYKETGKKFSLCVFVVLLLLCVARDFRGRFYEYKVLSLYKKVAADAVKHPSPLGIVFPSGGRRVAFYTGIPVEDIGDDKKMLPDFLQAQTGNLDIYKTFGDPLYLFIFIPTDFGGAEEKLKNLMPSGVEIVGHEYVDRKHKKELWAVKYRPREIKFDSSAAEFLTNGDFSQLLEGEKLKKSQQHLARRAPRFAKETSALPKHWTLYQSPTSFSNNWGGVEKREKGNVLCLQTDSYLTAISPRFDIRGDGEKRIFFTVKANCPSHLKISRVYRNPGAEYSIMFNLPIPTGSKREYSFLLPQSSKNHTTADVQFLLFGGDIELSNVKIASQAVDKKVMTTASPVEKSPVRH